MSYKSNIFAESANHSYQAISNSKSVYIVSFMAWLTVSAVGTLITQGDPNSGNELGKVAESGTKYLLGGVLGALATMPMYAFNLLTRLQQFKTASQIENFKSQVSSIDKLTDLEFQVLVNNIVSDYIFRSSGNQSYASASLLASLKNNSSANQKRIALKEYLLDGAGDLLKNDGKRLFVACSAQINAALENKPVGFSEREVASSAREKSPQGGLIFSAIKQAIRSVFNAIAGTSHKPLPSAPTNLFSALPPSYEEAITPPPVYQC